jgi:hypothetical protein
MTLTGEHTYIQLVSIWFYVLFVTEAVLLCNKRKKTIETVLTPWSGDLASVQRYYPLLATQFSDVPDGLRGMW